jgi:hypothetical protein
MRGRNEGAEILSVAFGDEYERPARIRHLRRDGRQGARVRQVAGRQRRRRAARERDGARDENARGDAKGGAPVHGQLPTVDT